jgi:hypothetical protein
VEAGFARPFFFWSGLGGQRPPLNGGDGYEQDKSRR